jgi:hypothetical protein
METAAHLQNCRGSGKTNLEFGLIEETYESSIS